MDLYYPNFLEQTYRVPPIHFNIQKISKQRQYEILEMPMSKDTRGDEGENRVVSAIEILGLKYEVVRPVFIICDFQYNNYLNKLKENMFIKVEFVWRGERVSDGEVKAKNKTPSRQASASTHTHAHSHMHAHTHMHACIHTHTRMQAHTYPHSRSSIRMHTLTHMHAHTYLHAHTYARMHTHAHVHTHKCMHAHSHIRTHT